MSDNAIAITIKYAESQSTTNGIPQPTTEEYNSISTAHRIEKDH
jgi:hypothetical protein